MSSTPPSCALKLTCMRSVIMSQGYQNYKALCACCTATILRQAHIIGEGADVGDSTFRGKGGCDDSRKRAVDTLAEISLSGPPGAVAEGSQTATVPSAEQDSKMSGPPSSRPPSTASFVTADLCAPMSFAYTWRSRTGPGQHEPWRDLPLDMTNNCCTSLGRFHESGR